MKIKLLILCFLSLKLVAQEPFFLMNFTDKLEINVKASRNAVVICYNYDQIRLICGNGKTPSTSMVTESIKEFLAKMNVPAVFALISPSAPSGPGRKDFYKLLTEHEIDNVILFSFIPMSDLDFILNPGVHVGTPNAIPADHPACNERMEWGLFSTIQIIPFSGDELLYQPDGDAYMQKAGGIKMLFNVLEPVFSAYKGNGTPTEIEFEYDLTKKNKIIPQIPEDIDDAPIFIIEKEVYTMVGKPKGLVNKMGFQAVESGNKTVDKDNQKMRGIYASYDLNFFFYTISNPIPDNLKSGYVLSWVDCNYDISSFLGDSTNWEAGTDINLKTLATFNRISTPTTTGPCNWQNPPTYRYYYLTDIVSGNIYLVDYNVESLDKDPSGEEALKTYMNLLTNH